MALDGAFLYAVKSELMFLIGSRVDKIHQPSREEIVISMRAKGGMQKLFISANAGSARVHITKKSIENPKAPPMFCMLMRKHIGSGKLVNIRQDGLERILFLDFEAVNELGDLVIITVACEIMGRCSNIILINHEGRIIDSIKRVDEEMSRERPVLPGMRYEAPPRDDRLSLFTCTREQLSDALRNSPNAELSKSLIRTFEGISPIVAREWTFYAGRGGELTTADISRIAEDRLFEAIQNTKIALEEGKCRFCTLTDKQGLLKDFSFIRIDQYGFLMTLKEQPSACDTLDSFFSERDAIARMKQRSSDLFRLLVNLTERIARRLEIQKQELKQSADREQLKLCGDLISANIYQMEKGMNEITVQNFYEESCPDITIKLDARLTPSQNMQRYFSEYRKAVTAEKKLTELIAKGEEELSYIDSVFDALTRTNGEDEVMQIKAELAEQGYVKSVSMKGKQQPKSLPPIEYESPSGYRILVGRNNVQNDKLTLKTAEKSDIWLHTKDIPGSHVIICTGGSVPDDETILFAARIAARHSKAANSAQVPVDYVPVKFVKKPSGAKPGKVIFTNNRTVYVTPAEI
ncbi:MAG: NFACT RNA binding domain-containing protein [Ruminococcus sp.]|nr:NFACT RNA binding domain-containing protein [Ruminococcus sp.]